MFDFWVGCRGTPFPMLVIGPETESLAATTKFLNNRPELVLFDPDVEGCVINL